jgi:type III restriction enzyme
VRCVVSVAMLTEGWDANNVTHILGIRAFGTQLLCEQVIGRALRRQSYQLNDDSRFDAEYADIFGVPFDFTAKPVVSPPQPPRETIQVKAVRPERDALEISFPRVDGYRIELPEERLSAVFDEDSKYVLTPDIVGPTNTTTSGIIGEQANIDVKHLKNVRPSTLLMNITTHLLYSKWRDPGDEPKLHLFSQLKRIVRQWLDTCLVCKGDTYPAMLMYRQLADHACERIHAGINATSGEGRVVKVLLDPYNPTGSTSYVRFNTGRPERWSTNGPPPKNHVNWVMLDSEWEAELCRIVEAHPKVIAYAKNHNLGLEVPYRHESEARRYLPDFIVRVEDGHGPADLLNLVVEVKGYRREDAKMKKVTMNSYWIPGVNQLKTYGRWAFAEFDDVYAMEADFKTKLEAQFNNLVSTAVAKQGSV